MISRRAIALACVTLTVTICLPATVRAQKLHALLVGDTNVESLKPAVEYDLLNLELVLYASVPRQRLEVRTLQGDFSFRDFLERLDQFAVGPSDAILVYWSGHGAFDQNGHYFQMPDHTTLNRERVREKMEAKGARLAVLISDTCNRYQPRLFPRAPRMAPLAVDTVKPLLESLFFEHQGTVNVNAVSEGEAALCSNVAAGGLFTLAMAYGVDREFRGPGDTGSRDAEVEEIAPGTKPGAMKTGVLWRSAQAKLSWEEFLKEVENAAQEQFDRERPQGYSRGGVVQRRQTLKIWGALPRRSGGSNVNVIALRPGDLIFSVNGVSIDDYDDFYNAVKGSPAIMVFRVKRGKEILDLRAQLRGGDGSRFGVYADSSRGGGVRVTKVCTCPGYPGTHVQVVQKKMAICLEPGDIILSVNGRQIRDTDALLKAVKNSPADMTLTVKNVRNGQNLDLKATLRPGPGSRFGVEADDRRGPGARVREVNDGYPASRCEPAN